MTGLRLAGVGTALPEHRLTQAEAVELHASFCGFEEGRARTLRALYRRSGVDTRHSVLLENSQGELPTRQRFYPAARSEGDRGPTTVQRMAAYEAHAPALAVSAARRALEAGQVDVGEVTHLVTVSCTGFVAPGVDSAIVEELGLLRGVRRTHIGFMGCYGALAALRVVDSIVAADSRAVPLLCSVELCTLHFSYDWDPELLVANALFSDGAAAVVGRGGGSAPWRVVATGTHLLADAEDAMTWRIGDHGFRMTLSPRIPDLIEGTVRPWLEAWLAEEGLSLDDVGSWAIHPGGPRILSSCRRALGLPRESTAVSEEVLRECGNMSSATVLFILQRMASRRSHGPCVALAFGPGLAIEATLLV
ncbi:MAG: type III polyketide synthase [Gemmatimonadetes bacterium]|nr:type III polyketide synthase [Gemmatimonadota bacterium]NNL31030.1 type III polyketide synthase [Gemmatimonadota bacterium]